MTKRPYSLFSTTALGLMLGMGLSGVQLNAQQSDSQQAPPSAQQPAPPHTQNQAQPGQVQTFAGTIMKSGDKYVLQDTEWDDLRRRSSGFGKTPRRQEGPD